MSGRLRGYKAIVVGGASGFGLAVAERFSEEGATVVVGGRRGDLAREVGERLGGTGFEVDVTDFDQLAGFAEEAVAYLGGLDVAISFAGFDDTLPIRSITPDRLEPMVDVMFNGAIYFMRFAGNAMAADGGGSLINVSSLTAHAPASGKAAYAGSKAGLEYATRIAAIEYGPDQVRVNAIAPHMILTEMNAELFASGLITEAARIQTPLGRLGAVDDVANACLFLASDESRYITGETLKIDGGCSSQKLPTRLDCALIANVREDLADGSPLSTLPGWFTDPSEESPQAD